MFEPMNIRDAVREEFTAVLRDAGKPVPAFEDNQVLLSGGLGLDSLDFAVLVVRLEQRLGCDPFNSSALERFPVNFGELVALYQGLVTRSAATDAAK